MRTELRTTRPGRIPAGLAVATVVVAAAGAVAWQALPQKDPPPPAAKNPRPPPLRATPANLDAVFAAADGGDTILLAAGDYGSFAAGVKPAVVTIRPWQGASARMSLALSEAANVRLEGLTIDGADISGTSHGVTIARSTFTHQAVIHAERMSHADIVLERNRFPGIDVCRVCYEGRVHVLGSSRSASGVVIRGNILGPGGDADGIQLSANGVQVLDNTFVGIEQTKGGRHSDALQLYGAPGTVIRGNYFRDVSTAIMAPDGAHHELIEHNVFDTGGYPYAIMLGGDHGSVIRHNTLADLGGCAWNLPCGTLLIGGPAGRGTVVRDNILGRLSFNDSKLRAADHNLIAIDGAGEGDRIGRPEFVGGTHPRSRHGFRLAGGSPGAGAASDGTDVGAAAGD